MNLTHIINDIVANLANWEKAGLNEAQTRQVIVLRLFLALGYDIWNPFEVIAERNSGGGAGGYIPDFTLRLDHKECFIVEVKALGKEFSNNDRTQAVNYVNSMGLRWAILTNGKQWLFFDNKQEGVATDRLVMTIDLTTSYAADHLEKLLAPAVWRSSQANQTVWEAVQFLKLESKLRQIMQRGFARDRDGLEIAIEVKLAHEERQLAESHFEELCQRILSVQQVVSSTSPVPTVALAPRETSFSVPVAFSGPMVVKSQTEILQLLREKIEQATESFSSRESGLTAVKLDGVEIKANNWRDILAGIAETFISLGRDREIPNYIPKEGESGHQYRQLSNGKYLCVSWNAKDLKKRINKWLRTLQVPSKVLAVTYKDETHYLPSPISTSVVSPSRDAKETASASIISPKPTVAKSQTEILQLLREKIEMVSQTTSTRGGFDIAARLNGMEIKANSWRDILTGIAETFISLGREGEILNQVYDSPGEGESSFQRYRQLSNGRYLWVSWSAKNHKRYINKWLKKLQVPLKVLALTYKDETYYLPSPVSTSVASPSRDAKETASPSVTSSKPAVVKSQTEILQLLREKIEQVTETFSSPSRESRFTEVKLDGVEIKAKSWPDILTGLAETFIGLGRMVEIQNHIFISDSPEKRESGYRYRQLSNDKYLRIDWSAGGLIRHINKWLRKLQLPTKVLAVTYKDETYHLPSLVSTSVASPNRDAKETASPSVTSSKPAVVKSQTEILQLLREKIEMVSQNTSAHGFDVTVMLKGVEVKANTWRNVFTGMAETFIGLGREGDIQKYIYESYEPGHYQLSNGKSLRVPGTYQNYKKNINKWLKMLQLPPEILAVTYRGETYCLPM